jgi:imidazolonepropionase-like amidohydrolase
LLITNARVLVGTGGRVINNATIAISGTRIEAVSERALDAGGATVIDAGGRTVLPSLINGHFHLFFDFQGRRYFPRSDADAKTYMEREVREKLTAHLEQGFTSLLSPIDMWPYIADVRDLVASGAWQEPRLFIADGVLMSPGGHYVCRSEQGEARQWCDEHISFVVDGPEKAREGVRYYAQRRVDVIMYDGLTNARPVPEVVAAMEPVGGAIDGTRGAYSQR